MTVKLQKWGNSLGLRIPSAISKELSLETGTCLIIKKSGNKIIIEPNAEPTLAQMLAKITPDNIHGETKTGATVGKEKIDFRGDK